MVFAMFVRLFVCPSVPLLWYVRDKSILLTNSIDFAQMLYLVRFGVPSIPVKLRVFQQERKVYYFFF